MPAVQLPEFWTADMVRALADDGRRYETVHGELLVSIRTGAATANVSFVDLCALLRHLGFAERQRGSHHIFRRRDVSERINLQAWGADAKPHQVRQVRAVLLEYDLMLEREAD